MGCRAGCPLDQGIELLVLHQVPGCRLGHASDSCKSLLLLQAGCERLGLGVCRRNTGEGSCVAERAWSCLFVWQINRNSWDMRFRKHRQAGPAQFLTLWASSPVQLIASNTSMSNGLHIECPVGTASPQLQKRARVTEAPLKQACSQSENKWPAAHGADLLMQSNAKQHECGCP